MFFLILTNKVCRFKGKGFRCLTKLKQVATRPGGFRKFPNFLQGDQFAVMFGNDAQAGGDTVFGIGLFVKGEFGFQGIILNLN